MMQQLIHSNPHELSQKHSNECKQGEKRSTLYVIVIRAETTSMNVVNTVTEHGNG